MHKYIIHLALFLGIISCSIKPLPSETRAEKNARTLQEDPALYLARQSYSKIDRLDERIQVLERELKTIKLNSDSSVLSRLAFLEHLSSLQSNEILTLNLEISHRPLKGFNLGKQGKVSHSQKPLNQAWKFFHQKKYDEAAQLFREWNEASKSHLPEFWFWCGESYLRAGNQSGALDCLHKAVSFRSYSKEDLAHLRLAYLYYKQGLNDLAKNQLKKLRLLIPDSEYISWTFKDLKNTEPTLTSIIDQQNPKKIKSKEKKKGKQ